MILTQDVETKIPNSGKNKNMISNYQTNDLLIVNKDTEQNITNSIQ